MQEDQAMSQKKIQEAWTKEQYDVMQVKAHELGYHLTTPYRKGLKNVRVGVIKANQ